MDTQAYDSIVQFCVEQHVNFDVQAWRRRSAADRKLIAVTAKYLSMTSWFGHEDQLERLAVEFDPCLVDSSEFDRESGAIGFNLAFFSSAVRFGIAARKAPATRVPVGRESVMYA